MAKIISAAVEKYRKIPLQAKASMWFIFCSVLQRGISFFTVPFFTRAMSAEQYGVYSTYTSWYSVLITFTSLNLYYGVFNNAMVRYENQREKFISSMQGLTTAITLAFFAVYLIFRKSINLLLEMPTLLVLILFVELLVTPAFQFWLVHNRFRYRYRAIVVVTLLKALINPILGIILVLCSEQKDVARIISIVAVELIFCGVIAAYQFYKGRCFFSREFWKYAFWFNLPLLPHYLSGSLLNQGDRIMISKLVGSSEVAFYNVAYNIGILMNMLTTAISSSFVPWIYHKLKEKDTAAIRRTANLLMLIMSVAVVALMLVSPEVMKVLAPEEYADAVYVIPSVASSVFFTFIYNIFSNVEFYYDERRFVTVGSVTAAVLNIVLNLIFIPVFGYHAAGYTTLLCYIVYGLSHLYFSIRVCKKHMGKSDVFSVGVTLGFTLAILILTALVNLTFSSIIVRYTILAVILIAAVIKRRAVMSAIMSLRNK